MYTFNLWDLALLFGALMVITIVAFRLRGRSKTSKER
jgi:hypothetical protein